jgi:hypothetical protein
MTPKLERTTRLREFWADLNNALVEAKCMNAIDAALMIESRFDEYSELWPLIQKTIADNRYYQYALGRAFAVRYMLDESGT